MDNLRQAVLSIESLYNLQIFLQQKLQKKKRKKLTIQLMIFLAHLSQRLRMSSCVYSLFVRPLSVHPHVWMTSPLKSMCKFSSNFMWRPVKGGLRIYTEGQSPKSKMSPCPYMVKGWIWYITILKDNHLCSNDSSLIFDLFTAMSYFFAWLCICMGKMLKYHFLKMYLKLMAEMYNVWSK